MTEVSESAVGNPTDEAKPTWRKVVDFPLVSLAIAIAAVAAVLAAASFGFKQMPPMLGKDADRFVQVVLIVAALFALSKLVLRHLGEQPRDDLPLGIALKDLGIGVLGGVWLMTLVVGVAAILGAYRITGWGGSTDALRIFLMTGLWAGFAEELLMRGILFRWLEQFAGSWAALAISSLVFGLGHLGNPNATVFSSIAIAIEAGILLGAAYMFTRSLWLAMGLHAGWNVTQGYLWDVPVSGNAMDGLVDARLQGPELLSGGAFGLEASIVAVVIVTTAGLWLLREAVRRGHVVKPWWTRRKLARQAVAA